MINIGYQGTPWQLAEIPVRTTGNGPIKPKNPLSPGISTPLQTEGCWPIQLNSSRVMFFWIPKTLLRPGPIGSPTNPSKKRRGRTNIRIIDLSTSETSTLCKGITYGKANGKLCHMKAYTSIKHPKEIMGSLLPWHDYLILPGSHIVHPFLLFCYICFSDGTIQNLQQNLVSLEEGANIRSLCSTTLQYQMEEESICILTLAMYS